MTTMDVVERTGLSKRRVQQAAQLYATKRGRDWYWTERGVERLLERRGCVGKRMKGRKGS